MAKQPDKYDVQHLRNLGLTARQLDRIFDMAAREAAAIGASIHDFNPGKPFSFADYPQTKAGIDRLIKKLQKNVETAVVNGVRSGWTLASNKNSALCDRVFGDSKYKLSKAQERRYYSNSDKALEAFLKRKTAGLNLSDRVWNYTNQFKAEIEAGLDHGIRSGLPAAEMARDLKQYLRYPDKLFRRVRDEHGHLRLSKAAKAFHPGAGVYRSSYKNAMRLARTETNMAYRASDHERWQQLDFVVGIEVRLSNNHTVNGVPFTDVCDELKGKYPKTFKFAGWHPQCRCHAVSILKTPEELMRENEAILEGREPDSKSANAVKDIPENFKTWLANNKDRIEHAEKKGTLPYFLKDNANFAGIKINPKNLMEKAEIRRIEANRAEYERLKKDGNYMNVKFNEHTGGLLAIHKEHHFDPTVGKFGIPRGDYERISAETLYRYGRSAILGSEKMPDGVKPPEGLLDGRRFEIKGVESIGKNNIINDLKLASKKKVESIIFYYRDKNIFSEQLLIDGYNFYIRNSKSKRIQKVYYIIKDKLYAL
jgi:hypothetical protein